jgi:hypothetical protein
VGYEKRANWGVAEHDESAFVAAVLEGQPEPPRYFAVMKQLNRDGPPVLGQPPVARRLTAAEVVSGSSIPTRWLLDLRPANEFAEGFIRRQPVVAVFEALQHLGRLDHSGDRRDRAAVGGRGRRTTRGP